MKGANPESEKINKYAFEAHKPAKVGSSGYLEIINKVLLVSPQLFSCALVICSTLPEVNENSSLTATKIDIGSAHTYHKVSDDAMARVRARIAAGEFTAKELPF